jgi:hypothetical protein
VFQEGFVDPEELKEAKLNGNACYYENDNEDDDDDDDIDDDNFLFVTSLLCYIRCGCNILG